MSQVTVVPSAFGSSVNSTMLCASKGFTKSSLSLTLPAGVMGIGYVKEHKLGKRCDSQELCGWESDLSFVWTWWRVRLLMNSSLPVAWKVTDYTLIAIAANMKSYDWWASQAIKPSKGAPLLVVAYHQSAAAANTTPDEFFCADSVTSDRSSGSRSYPLPAIISG